MFSSYLDFRFVLHDKSDFQREFPFCSGFPIGASSIPVGTRLSPESLVCYTFVEQMAAGNVAHPGKCGYSCGVLAGKVAPFGAA